MVCQHTSENDTNRSGISIGLLGDFTASAEGPAPLQMEALVSLVKHLLKTFEIKQRLVWRASDIDATDSPGNNFPWRNFLYKLR